MSEIIADHLKGRPEITIYDPTSGSGSLLITIGAAVAKHLGSGDSIKYYAQELKENTYNLTRMNLIMRGISPDNITVRNGDTLAEDWPWFDDNDPAGTYDPLYVDAVVSNPPYSQDWDPDPSASDPRFDDYGWAPKSKADYAFLLHDLYHLRPDGIMCIVLLHGVLFRGGEESEIRKNLIERDQIQAIIGLPPNIFFGTPIPTIIMVLRQKRAESDVLIVDASKGFEKEGKNNKLRASDIKRVVDTVTGRITVEKYSRLVSKQEIRDNGYNLSIPRYVDSSEPPETWDLYASMLGGVPRAEVDALEPWWKAFPGLRETLFAESANGSLELAVSDERRAVEEHPAVTRFRERFHERFKDFGAWLFEELVDEPTSVVVASEEDRLTGEVFTRLQDVPLVDKYAAYQLIHDAWQTISADVEVLQTEGSSAVRAVDPKMVVKKKGGKDIEVQEGWEGHILPFDLVQRTLLCEDLDALVAQESRLEQIGQELEELVEGASEEDKQCEAFNEVGDAFVTSAIAKVIKAGSVDSELLVRLKQAKSLLDEEKRLKRSIKDTRAALEQKTKERIAILSDDEVRELLAAKWIDPLVDDFDTLPGEVISDLTKRVQALAEKYQTTLSQIDNDIEQTEAELVGMLGDLRGSDRDMAGIGELIRLLGGECHG